MQESRRRPASARRARRRDLIGTREVLAHMLWQEEEHADYFESQLNAIEHVDLENYLARYTLPESI